MNCVKQPIDIKIMKEKLNRGEYDHDPYNKMLEDFSLLSDNALDFNLPKTDAHKAAKKLYLLGMQAFNFFKENLQLSEMKL
jgi:hypothetical protein